MESQITFEVSFNDEGRIWTVGVLSRWNGRIEICRSHQCGPFTTAWQVEDWLLALWTAWVAPTLGADCSESLHDAYAAAAP